MDRVLVVGAGVLGLTCAVRLLESGHRVDVLARDLPLETTSVVAAALWYPYLAEPRDRVAAWGATAYAEMVALAEQRDSGVRMLEGTEMLATTESEPWWSGAVPDLRHVPAPAPYADAWRFTAPAIDMPIYLRWLHQRVEELGGTLTRAALGGLPQGGLVVDCAGLGARRLAGDETVQPVRGQVLLIENVHLESWWLDGAGPTYVVPREQSVVVGGTSERGEWSRTPSAETAREILARATRLVPELGQGRVVAHRVGLRPARPAVRLEVEGRIVHCYGHGGAGVTLSWGCADEVCGLVNGLSE